MSDEGRFSTATHRDADTVRRLREGVERSKDTWPPGGAVLGVNPDEAEALCDLADAAREVEKVRTNGDLMRVQKQIDAALARLDGEDTG